MIWKVIRAYIDTRDLTTLFSRYWDLVVLSQQPRTKETSNGSSAQARQAQVGFSGCFRLRRHPGLAVKERRVGAPALPQPPAGPSAPPTGAPGGTGPAASPGGMQGSAAHSMTAVKVGLEAFQRSLPGLPMGSDLHTAVLKAVADVSKHMTKGADDQSGMVQQLAQLARSAQTSPQQSALARMSGGPTPQGAAPAPAPTEMAA